MRVLRPIGHEDQLSIVDHLDELRSRLLICGAALVVAFCVCFVFNHALINALNRPLPQASKTGLGAQQRVNKDLGGFLSDMHDKLGAAGAKLQASGGQVGAAGTDLTQAASDAAAAAKLLSKAQPTGTSTREKLITLGPAEPFTVTLVAVGYFSLLITLPLILYQLYAFVLPALSGEERRVALPSMIAAPVLFILGAGFSYFEIVPPAIHFLQGYNADEFQTLLQAGTFYRFEVLLMIGIGAAFEVPLFLLALQKLGVITARTLTLNWRYAAVIIAILAAALPGVDPVTMTLETVPLILLYVASIVMLKWVEHRNYKRQLAEMRSGGDVAGDSSAS